MVEVNVARETSQKVATHIPASWKQQQDVIVVRSSELAQQVDDLHQLRGLIRQSQAAEKVLTGQIVEALQITGVSQFDGAQATAVLGSRTVLTPDPQLFLEALGDKAFGALRVSVEAARELMVPADLEAISEIATGSVLRVIEKKKVA